MRNKTVFISAPAPELKEHRNAIYEKMQEVTGWRCLYFTSASYSFAPLGERKREMLSCNLFIGVVGHSYQPVLKQSSQSVAEVEYYWAKSAGVDQIVFLAPDDFLVPANRRELDAFWHKQQQFRSQIKASHHCHSFDTPEDLAQKVHTALSNREREYWAPLEQLISKVRIHALPPESSDLLKVVLEKEASKISLGDVGFEYENPTKYPERFLKPPQPHTVLGGTQTILTTGPLIVSQRDMIIRMEDKLMSKSGDIYNVGQAGAVGLNTHAQDMTFTQVQSQAGESTALSALTEELSILRKELRKEATEPEHDTAIGAVASAETEAKKGDKAKALEYLSQAGKWALDVAAKVGVGVATAAIKEAMGIK